MTANRVTSGPPAAGRSAGIGTFQSNLIEVWLVDIASIDLSLTNSLLDQNEQARAAEIENVQMRRQYICTRIYSRLILADWLGIEPEKIVFSYDSGRPVCLNKGAPNFSLSKRDTWIAMAISTGPIGIDLERMDHQAADQYVVEELFSSAEREVLTKLSAHDRSLAYFFMWTQKEAYSKATGRGAEMDFANIQTSPEGGLITNSSDGTFGNSLYGHAISAPKDYVLTVVSPHENPEISLGGATP